MTESTIFEWKESRSTSSTPLASFRSATSRLDPMPEEELARPREAFPLRVWIVGGCAGLLLVLFVLAWIAPRVLRYYAVLKTPKVDVDLAQFEIGLEEYSRANGGQYPDNLEALVVPDRRTGDTYIKGRRVPLDPWGNEYLYDPPGPYRPRPRVYTLGRDGTPGGEGDDADVDNLSLRSED